MNEYMRKIKSLNYIYAECARIFTQPLIWVSIIGIGFIKLINLMGNSYVYDVVIKDGIKEMGLLNSDHMWGKDTFLGYVTYCLAALPVVGGYIDECISGRINNILTRISKLNYIIGHIFIVTFVVSVCTLLGNALFMVLGHYSFDMPYVDVNNIFSESSDLQRNGQWFTFWIVTEIQNCMQATFYTLLAVAVSLFIKEKQFIVVLPMIFRYIFLYFFNEHIISWIPMWLSPRSIYLYNHGMYIGNDIAQCVYSIVFTMCVCICVAIMMYMCLRRSNS